MSTVANDSESQANGETPEIKVKDRRRFTAEGDPIEPAAEDGTRSEDPAIEDQAARSDAPAADEATDAAPANAELSAETPKEEEPPRGGPLPPASFEMLILSLGMQAQMELGMGAPQPENPPNLEIARHTIDLLAVLQEKTKGNLSLEENRLMENTLTELRFRYVQAVGDISKTAANPSS